MALHKALVVVSRLVDGCSGADAFLGRHDEPSVQGRSCSYVLRGLRSWPIAKEGAAPRGAFAAEEPTPLAQRVIVPFLSREVRRLPAAFHDGGHGGVEAFPDFTRGGFQLHYRPWYDEPLHGFHAAVADAGHAPLLSSQRRCLHPLDYIRSAHAFD